MSFVTCSRSILVKIKFLNISEFWMGRSLKLIKIWFTYIFFFHYSGTSIHGDALKTTISIEKKIFKCCLNWNEANIQHSNNSWIKLTRNKLIGFPHVVGMVGTMTLKNKTYFLYTFFKCWSFRFIGRSFC